MEITLVIADPHPVLRAGIRSFCASRPEIRVLGDCESDEQLIDLVRAVQPRVAVLDPAIAASGLEDLMKHLGSACPSTGVIVHAASHDPVQIRLTFEAGAAGYILKDGPAVQLLEAVAQIAGGGRYLSPLVNLSLDTLLSPTVSSTSTDPRSMLTEREYEVFLKLGAGVRPRDIARSLDLSAKTVDTYRANILRKLNLESMAALVRMAARGNGD